MNIKTFEQFKNDNKPMNEGLIDMLKARKEILKLQGVVCDEYERLLQEDPKKYKDGKSVLKAVEKFAQEAYEKIVKSEDALSFQQWWEKLEKSNNEQPELREAHKALAREVITFIHSEEDFIEAEKISKALFIVDSLSLQSYPETNMLYAINYIGLK